jgi:hypothetical protein
VTANEQVIHRWLAQATRARLVIEAAWPSREDPVGRVHLEGDLLAGGGPSMSARWVWCCGASRAARDAVMGPSDEAHWSGTLDMRIPLCNLGLPFVVITSMSAL